MNERFKSMIAISLLLVYSISLNVAINTTLLDVVLQNDFSKQQSLKALNDTPYNYYYSNTFEPLAESTNTIDIAFESKSPDLIHTKVTFPDFHIVSQNKQYLNKSKHITPSLSVKKLLFPFHDFI